jgi:predicted AlkP superfamily phosphohydrolase/phosphomutase
LENSKYKIAIIGIDGATWRVIEPWAAEGRLPTFSRLMKQGAWGALQSTIPPITAPAWSSLMTGKNPGGHGLFDFIEHKPNAYGISYTFGGQRKCPTVWDILSDRGYRVGVINVPMTYPPDPINGYMISGMDTPDETSPFIYPRALKDEIWKKLGGIKLDIHHLGYMDTDEKRFSVLDQLMRIEEERTELVEYMFKNHPTDVIMTVLNSVDQVQHHFWHYMDPLHPRYDHQGHGLFGEAVLKICQHADSMLKKLVNIFGDDTLIILASDHGFGPSSNKMICINKALEKGGFLSFKPTSAILPGVLDNASRFLRDRLPPQVKQKIAKILPWARAHMETLVATSNIDWKNTQAYCFETSVTSPNIWINLKDKRPEGTVNAEDYMEVRGKVKSWLLSIKDPKTGGQAIPNIYEKETIYPGSAVDNAPDLILSWWEGEGFTPWPSVINGRVVGSPIVEYVSHPLSSGKEWGGTHTMEGIVLLKGPGIIPGDLTDSRIIDIAPTIFSALGEPVNDYFDGHPLIEFHRDKKQINDAGGKSIFKNTKSTPELSETEQSKIENRLRQLGYIE